MDKLRIRLTGRLDARSDEYFFTTTRVPISVDLSDSVILFFPDEDEEGQLGGDLVIKKYDRKFSTSSSPAESYDDDEDKPRRVRRRRRLKSNSSDDPESSNWEAGEDNDG